MGKFVEFDDLTLYQRSLFRINRRSNLKRFLIDYIKSPSYKRMKKKELIRTLISDENLRDNVNSAFERNDISNIERLLR